MQAAQYENGSPHAQGTCPSTISSYRPAESQESEGHSSVFMSAPYSSGEMWNILNMSRLQPALELMLAAEIDIRVELVRLGNAGVEDVVLQARGPRLLIVVVVLHRR